MRSPAVPEPAFGPLIDWSPGMDLGSPFYFYNKINHYAGAATQTLSFNVDYLEGTVLAA